MRGRVKAVLLAVLVFSLSSPSAFSDCSWTPRFSGQFRTTALDVAVDGGFVWLATGYGVQLLQGATIVDSVPLPGQTRVITIGPNGYVYAGSGSRIYALRRDGTSIRILGSAAASGTVNDIVATSYLFAATSAGIDHFDLLDPAKPFRTNVTLPVSSTPVTSLALSRGTLYAADGDFTIEVFSLALASLPQHTGVIETMPRATSVHATDDNFLFVSDKFGQTTDIITGTTRLARLPFGTNAFAGSTSKVHFVAGPDRTLRAIDFTVPAKPAKLFEQQLAPAGGTDNVIHAVERSGNTLYVAAGDIGLVTLDLTNLSQPYPMTSYATGATTSVLLANTRAWFTQPSGRISEQTIVASGISLREERAWDAPAGSAVRDLRSSNLLTTSGAVATIWDASQPTPTVYSTSTFPSTIANAVIARDGIVALLANNTVWKVPLNGGNPEKSAISGAVLLARSDDSLAVAEVAGDGNSILHYFASGDLSVETRSIPIAGAASGSIALSGSRAAVFTYTGINVVDLASGNVSTIPDSNRVIPQQLAFSGDDLLAIDGRRLFVFANARTLAHEQTLPANAVAFDAEPSIAAIATTEGVAATLYLRELPAPQQPFSNNYYREAAAAAGRLYLFSDDGVDVFSTTTTDAPRYITSVRSAGMVDLAASARSLFVVSANGTVTAYSRDGVMLAQASVAESFDVRPKSIDVVGNSVWVSLSTGCSTGACVQKTLVLDPATLNVSATISGTIDDVVFSPTRAYALTSDPAEIRVFNIGDSLHPTTLVTAQRPAGSTSIAYDAGTVYVIGDKLLSYAESTLVKTGERFSSVTPDPLQHLRIESGCVVITSRSDSPELYTAGSWTAAASHDVPSPVRTFAIDNGRLLILTQHSLEVWSSRPTPEVKRRAVR